MKNSKKLVPELIW